LTVQDRLILLFLALFTIGLILGCIAFILTHQHY
jgi:hypothetical protein